MTPIVRDGVDGLCALILGALLMLLTAGCSSSSRPTASTSGQAHKVDIGGKVHLGGKRLQVSKAGEIKVRFYSEGLDDPHAFSRSADVDEQDGTFAIKGIPLGKYRIGVYQIDPRPSHDLLHGRFSKKNTPIIRDVERNGQVFDIDLAKEKPVAASPSPVPKSVR